MQTRDMQTGELRGEGLDEGRYSANLAAILKLDAAPTFVARPTPGAEIAVTSMRRATPQADVVGQACREDACVVSVSMLDGYLRDFWLDGRPIELPPQPAGYVTMLDRRHTVLTRYKSAVHNMRFDFPIASLRAIADEAHLRPFGDLQIKSCNPVRDETLRHLVSSVLPAFERPKQVNRLFIDHIGAAVGSRVLENYGGLGSRPARGGLAPWQRKRAEEMLAANLAAEVPLTRIAAECQLSTSHFSRAFRQSTGLPPHRWLLKLRVDKAKSLLRESALSLTDVARDCGFADQRHSTRVFTRWVGQGPGAWRRCVLQ